MPAKTWDEEKIKKILSRETQLEMRAKTVLDAQKEPYSLQLLLEPKEAMLMCTQILKLLAGKKIIHITANTPYKKLVAELEQNSIGTHNFFFIDLLSPQAENNEPHENAISLESPKNLAECLEETERALEEINSPVVIVDSVSTLLVYNDKSSVEKFVHSLISKVNSAKASVILLNTDVKEQETVTKTISQFTEKTIIV